MVEELAPRDFLEDEIKSIGLLEILDKVDDVLVGLESFHLSMIWLGAPQYYLAVVEEINFLENPGPAVSGHFLNDLDSVFNVCEDVGTSLHRCVSSPAEHFAREPVDLLEGVGSK